MLPFCSITAMGAQLPGVRLVGQSRGEEEMLRETTRLPRKYELMTIVSPDVADDELPAMIDRIGGFITAAGGTISETLRESPWGRRRLAYAVRHSGRDVRDGFYTVYHFEAPPPAITDIERDLRLTDQVMRFLVTHYIPQPIVERPAEATEAGIEEHVAETEASVEVETPVAEAPAVEAEPEALDIEAPVVESEAEPIVEETPLTEEAETPIVEASATEEAEAPATEEVEAPPKKRAPRRKKAADAEETAEEPATE
jgi:small subunit ribosomal protein S6